MNKNVLILATSPRKNANSSRLAEAFCKGVKDAGNSAEIVYLYNKQVGFCCGCLSCQRTRKCIIKDDVNYIVDKMSEADVIVWASPIYYYDVCAQMKTLIDRSNPLFGTNYKFRDVYFLAASADQSQDAMDGAIVSLQGWLSCYGKAELKGVVKALGVEQIGDIDGLPALDEAYLMGKAV